VRLGQGDARETVWGCDLAEGYIRENAYYTS
jgi:N-acetylglutamate synthase/N-acetylornithine aminotransferase